MALETVLETKFSLTADKALDGLQALNLVKKRDKDVRERPCQCGNPRGNENYRVIFMDCNMPIMDGFQATQKIKEFLRERDAAEEMQSDALGIQV